MNKYVVYVDTVIKVGNGMYQKYIAELVINTDASFSDFVVKTMAEGIRTSEPKPTYFPPSTVMRIEVDDS